MTDGEVIRLGFTELSRVLNLFAGFQRSVASLDELISPHVSLFWGIRWICGRQWRVQLQRSIQLRTCASIRKFRERLPFLNALRCAIEWLNQHTAFVRAGEAAHGVAPKQRRRSELTFPRRCRADQVGE